MAYKKALVAFDGSEAAKKAIDQALQMKKVGLVGKILVLSISEPEEELPGYEAAARNAGILNEPGIAEVREATPAIALIEEQLAERFGEDADDLTVVIQRGKPAQTIVSFAEDMNCDLIVMGRRGRTGVSAMLGSVSGHVLRECKLPVFVVI